MSDPDADSCNECGYSWRNCQCPDLCETCGSEWVDCPCDLEAAKAVVNPVGGSGETDRGSWCTPKWLADALGRFFLDPCSNPRSHIISAWACSLEDGFSGLCEEEGPGVYQYWDPLEAAVEIARIAPDQSVFINPPYARGQVARWVKHWGDFMFTFLLRWDPSTDWFSELIRKCTHVWFPSRRINFEPPPGVKSSSNPFPHALFMRDPPADRLLRLAPLGYLIPVDNGLFAPQS